MLKQISREEKSFLTQQTTGEEIQRCVEIGKIVNGKIEELQNQIKIASGTSEEKSKMAIEGIDHIIKETEKLFKQARNS